MKKTPLQSSRQRPVKSSPQSNAQLDCEPMQPSPIRQYLNADVDVFLDMLFMCGYIFRAGMLAHDANSNK